ALTPAGRSGARADGFPARAGFGFSGRLATCELCFEAVLGSTCDGLRLTASLSAPSGASLRSLPEPVSLPTLGYLHVTDRSYLSISNLHGNHLSDC
ncbi:MAG: hypothetical protein LGR52_08810, partial [Candidatus Thiosymbion ectosymbiont of Robbea hypermnestra]|nr:hypothetical protein [Candidatus Thiosymbion ectosymbiont of Robbea hypermnestra]